MPTVQFRNLGSRGILHDPAAADLPDGAWSGGVNVRFDGLAVSRSPVFRVARDALSYTPFFIVGRRPSDGFDMLFTVATDGQMFSTVGATETNVTVPGFTPLPSDRPCTTTYLGNETYINRPSDIPVYWSGNSTTFATIPGWDATWRCAALRSYKDYLIALNVTKGSVAYPQMVKTSDSALAGLAPTSWDSTDSTTNATENVLADLTSALIDGASMRDAFILYSSEQIWSMQAVASNDVFTYTRLFSEGGIINTNCVVEVDGKHYVFGTKDIYRHDGISKQSLVAGRNQRHLYNSLNVAFAKRCHVTYYPALGEIYFAYVSGEGSATYDTTMACNRALVYHIPSDTTSFIDLPNVSSLGIANLNTILTWDTAVGMTWDGTGGSWYDQQDSFGMNLVGVSQSLNTTITHSRIVALDFMDQGSLALPYLEELNPPAWVSREYLDMDTIPSVVGGDSPGATLNVYKAIGRLYPQIKIYRNVPMTVRVGGALTPGALTAWTADVPFRPVTDYKVDVRSGGRYLAVRFGLGEAGDFDLTGFDVEMASRGNR